MNRTRYVLGVVFALGSCFTACNYTDGECFPRYELYDATAGAGAGPMVPTGVGAGGYGSVPFEPQSVDPDQEPVCNIISGGPCGIVPPSVETRWPLAPWFYAACLTDTRPPLSFLS